MGIPEWIAVISVIVALISLAIQQHLTRQQSKSEANARHYDRAQALILRALDDPVLLDAIGGDSNDDQKQRRYRQLWFNHVEMIFRQQAFFNKSHWQGTLNDIQSFVSMPAMKSHWEKYQSFYAKDFQDFMNTKVLIQDEAEAP